MPAKLDEVILTEEELTIELANEILYLDKKSTVLNGDEYWSAVYRIQSLARILSERILNNASLSST